MQDAAEGLVSVEGQETGEAEEALVEQPGGPAPNDDSAQSIPKTDHFADHLAGVIAELVEETKAHHARAAAREKVIDNLHEEVQRLRVGEQALLLRPVVIDLQTLRNDLLRQASTVPGELSARQVADLLESFALSVEQTLERCGSTPVRPAPGEAFSARDHRAVKVVAAESEEDDSTIAEVVADGYYDANLGRVTTPARVHVRKWTAPAPPAAPADPTPEPAAATDEKGDEGV